MTNEKKETTADESLEGTLEEFALVEKCRRKSWCVQFRVFERVGCVDVLIKDPQCQDRLGGVEKVVHGDKHWLKKGLQWWGEKKHTKT